MPAYDSFMFTPFEGIDRDRYVLALYSLCAETSDALELAQALVIEQTTGTWTAVPEETREVKERSCGRVLGVYEIPDYERELPKDCGERKLVFLAAFPVANIGGQMPELLTTLYGNISMIGKLKLLDVFLPPSLVGVFKGPKFGIEGMRKILGVEGRPVLCGMFKPCVGALPATLGKLAYEMAVGGVEVLKDDELQADPAFCPVEARVAEVEKALERARKETGRRSIYTVNVTDRPLEMYAKAEKAVKAGVSGIMVNMFTVGYAAFQDLAEDSRITVPLMAHPCFAGTFFESPHHGMTSHLALGKFARLSGADMVIYPSPYGKVPLLRDRAIRVAQELTAPFAHLKRAFPGPSAGMHPGTVAKTMADFGTDLLMGAGGGIHGHPGGPAAGGRAFHQAMEAALAGTPAREAARSRPELAAALDKWGDAESQQAYSLLR
jgi:2,3-diketo-5-methylthiopentyl-1-phosphate enolase